MVRLAMAAWHVLARYSFPLIMSDASNVALADIQLCVSGRPIHITGINYFGFDVRMPSCYTCTITHCQQALCCVVTLMPTTWLW